MMTDKEQVTLLRFALAGLLGVDSTSDFLGMLDEVKKHPGPEEDKALVYAAINAMLATAPDA